MVDICKGLTVPTVPEMVPRPIDPDLGTATVLYMEVNFWSYWDRKTVVTPARVAVTQTEVGHTLYDVDVVEVVV